MHLFDLTVFIFMFVGLAISFRAVWNIRTLKSELIEEHKQCFRQVLAAIGDIESMGDAKNRAIPISEIMKKYGVAGLILPLKSGGRVNFQLESTGIRINSD